jgi:hypothetical protein
VGLLGPNADGELLEPGRVADCYLGLLLRADDPDQASGCWWSARRGCCIPRSPNRTGRWSMSW